MDRTPADRHCPCRSSTIAPLLALVALPMLGAAPLLAGQDPNTFPPSELFRTLQLTAFACGRENSSEPCQKVRSMADPLLDHPLLPASCKDVLWTLNKRAVVAPSNSFQRRDEIDTAARRVVQLCRRRDRAPVNKATDGEGPGSLRLTAPSP